MTGGRFPSSSICPSRPEICIVFTMLPYNSSINIIIWIFYVLDSTLFHLPPLRFHCVAEDVGIEIRTVATLALAVRRSNDSARSHPNIVIHIITNSTEGVPVLG
jgi:hypothetical protein